MIEDYGTLSEEELIEQITNALQESEEIDATDLEFKYGDKKLLITGTLKSEEELEILSNTLEEYLDPDDYVCDVELVETLAATPSFSDQEEDSGEGGDDELGEISEDELDLDDDKWQ